MPQHSAASPSKTAILLALMAAVSLLIGTRSSAFIQGTDFPHFYAAARMLLDGRGHQLYDAGLQYKYQARYAGRIGTLYTHPPFETLFYVAVAWLSLKNAYLLWSILNVALLGPAMGYLCRRNLPEWNWQALSAASLIFAPVLLCLLQGQDSIILLLFTILAFTHLRRGSTFKAGCWLALGLFKFQVVLPLAAVLAIAPSTMIDRTSFAKGFASVAIVLVGVSAAISGWRVLFVYPEFLVHLSAQPLVAIMPQAMANFRGLAYLVFHREPPALAISAILAIPALACTLHAWRRAHSASTLTPAEKQARFDSAFSITVLFALLVSYHLNPHDLTVLLLPMTLILYQIYLQNSANERAAINYAVAALLTLLYLPPLHLWALKTHSYASVAVPLLMLFLATLLRESIRVRRSIQGDRH
jgi:hypothetical protein